MKKEQPVKQDGKELKPGDQGRAGFGHGSATQGGENFGQGSGQLDNDSLMQGSEGDADSNIPGLNEKQ